MLAFMFMYSCFVISRDMNKVSRTKNCLTMKSFGHIINVENMFVSTILRTPAMFPILLSKKGHY